MDEHLSAGQTHRAEVPLSRLASGTLGPGMSGMSGWRSAHATWLPACAVTIFSLLRYRLRQWSMMYLAKTTACVSPILVRVSLSLSGFASVLSFAYHVEVWQHISAFRKLLYGMFIAIFAVSRSTDSSLLGRQNLRL